MRVKEYPLSPIEMYYYTMSYKYHNATNIKCVCSYLYLEPESIASCLGW